MRAVGVGVTARRRASCAWSAAPDHGQSAGQGVVQFARSLADGHEHALKFFVSPNAFDRERRLYGDPTLGVLLPRLGRVCPNDDGAITDAFGEPLPSFIVMEKGEALDEWNRRAKPDLFQSVAVRLRMHGPPTHAPPEPHRGSRSPCGRCCDSDAPSAQHGSACRGHSAASACPA